MEQDINKLRKMVINPATGEKIDEIEETPIEGADLLYEKARASFLTWGKASINERLEFLRQLRLYMVGHLDEIADMIAKSTGKVAVEALTAEILTVLDAISHTEKHAPDILERKRVSTPLFLFGKKSYIEYKPRGVILIISPWNYPFQLAMIPVISAIAAGNTVILKPSEITPLVGKLIEDLFQKTGFPQDVVQVAHGGKELGAALVQRKPDYIFFTGSVRTGKIIQTEAAKHLIPTTLELGGKDPMIVFNDAPLERAVNGALWGAFTNSGQVCMSIERLYVQKEIYPDFVRKLKEGVNQLRISEDSDGDIGSMTFSGQVDIVKEHVENALADGAKLLTGQTPEQWNRGKGFYIPPMVMVDAKQEMQVVQEESFGPILPVIPFETEEEAIRLANDSAYGLHASIWSSDLKKAKRVASNLIAGNIAINDVIIPVANSNLPFGGTKQSGIGRYHGETGLLTLSHQTSVMLDYGIRKSEVNWYPYQGKYPLFADLIRYYFGRRINWIGFLKSFIGLIKKS